MNIKLILKLYERELNSVYEKIIEEFEIQNSYGTVIESEKTMAPLESFIYRLNKDIKEL